ncbi:protein angel homolog 2 isoform X2 [Ischnura elegans]|nr:protein angel homolog 2 isoform X2 [Ischnura elegans]
MSMIDESPLKKMKPENSDVEVVEVEEDDPGEVCIIFEKLANNPEHNEVKADESTRNGTQSVHAMKHVPPTSTSEALFRSPNECFDSTQQFYGGSSQSMDDKKVDRKRNQLKELRQLEYTEYGRSFVVSQKGEENSLPFTIMSYNVLSQLLLESHPHLYYNHNQAALSWDWRSKALLKEIEGVSPDVLCLQEVQESHLQSFYNPELQKLGYQGIYKKRTGDKPDGVAIYYKESVFNLEEYSTVEFMQPMMPVLNRDNVALIARFSSKCCPSLSHLCVATTHLLYNPRRMDVKLAQTQLLLAELERLAFIKNDGPSSYYPLIVTGDLNVTPKSSLYKLLTTGILLDNDVSDEMFDVLGITSNCQHFSLVNGRLSSESSSIDRISELSELKVYNSDHIKKLREMKLCEVPPEDGFKMHMERRKGHLSHNFVLKSVYEHRNSRGKEVTTKQDKWVTVDYIFYSCLTRGLSLEPIEGKLKLISRLGLLCKEECFAYGPIPNLGSPSDHFPLVCRFVLT